MAEITLDFVAKQLDRLTESVAAFREDLMVHGARLDRIDASTRAAVAQMEISQRAILDELRAMHS